MKQSERMLQDKACVQDTEVRAGAPREGEGEVRKNANSFNKPTINRRTGQAAPPPVLAGAHSRPRQRRRTRRTRKNTRFLFISLSLCLSHIRMKLRPTFAHSVQGIDQIILLKLPSSMSSCRPLYSYQSYHHSSDWGRRRPPCSQGPILDHAKHAKHAQKHAKTRVFCLFLSLFVFLRL